MIFCLINQVQFFGVILKGLDIQIFPIVVSEFLKRLDFNLVLN